LNLVDSDTLSPIPQDLSSIPLDIAFANPPLLSHCQHLFISNSDHSVHYLFVHLLALIVLCLICIIGFPDLVMNIIRSQENSTSLMTYFEIAPFALADQLLLPPAPFRWQF